MKRDLSLIREILLKLEPLPADFDHPIALTVGEGVLAFDGHSPTEIAYQIRLMTQGDLIAMGGIDKENRIAEYLGFRWYGHEFLDDVRDPEIWRKAKERARDVGGVGLGFLWEIAKAEIKMKLRLP